MRTISWADCDHVATEELGWGGATAYLRCLLCGGILMNQQGQRWFLRPASSPAATHAPVPATVESFNQVP